MGELVVLLLLHRTYHLQLLLCLLLLLPLFPRQAKVLHLQEVGKVVCLQVWWKHPPLLLPPALPPTPSMPPSGMLSCQHTGHGPFSPTHAPHCLRTW